MLGLRRPPHYPYYSLPALALDSILGLNIYTCRFPPLLAYSYKESEQVALANAQPSFLISEAKVPFEEVSLQRPVSGWRDIDFEVVKGMKDSIYSGTHKLHVSRMEDIILVKDATDASGNKPVDDGLQSATAWMEAKGEWVKDNKVNPLGYPWAPDVVKKFQQGFSIAFADYGDDPSAERRIMWNVGKHDEENNKLVSFSPIYLKIQTAQKSFRSSQGLEACHEGIPDSVWREQEEHRGPMDKGCAKPRSERFGQAAGDAEVERKISLGQSFPSFDEREKEHEA